MHAEMPVGERRFLFIDLKTVSFILTYLLMLSNTGKIIIDYFTIEEDNFTLIDVDNIHFPGNVAFPVVSIAPLLGAVTSIISFTVALFLGLYMDYRRLNIDLTFSCFIIAISAIYCFIWEFVFFVNPTATLQRVLIVAINAVLLYVIRCFWIRLDSYNRRLGEYAYIIKSFA